MQHPWWLPVRDLARHVLIFSLSLILFTTAAIVESKVTATAEHLITSKFAFRMLVCLEYAVVMSDAVIILIMLIKTVCHSLKRASR
jgi:hypothetical protein